MYTCVFVCVSVWKRLRCACALGRSMFRAKLIRYKSRQMYRYTHTHRHTKKKRCSSCMWNVLLFFSRYAWKIIIINKQQSQVKARGFRNKRKKESFYLLLGYLLLNYYISERSKEQRRERSSLPFERGGGSAELFFFTHGQVFRSISVVRLQFIAVVAHFFLCLRSHRQF